MAVDSPVAVRAALEHYDGSVIEILDAVLADAHAQGATDLHLEIPTEHLSVRLRVRGRLLGPYLLPAHIHGACIARIKVLAGLKTDIQNSFQDGSFSCDSFVGDIRVSIVPARAGERAVLRLPTNRGGGTLISLGVPQPVCAHIDTVLNRGSGLVLVCGATGSGKTSTLYALMHHVSGMHRSLVSIEDPVERSVEWMAQLPITAEFGFSVALRAVLRQDPDVIMIGEIRDAETAVLAIHAALTGHLVLASVHARTAVEVIARMRSLGADTSLLGSCLQLSVCQRLVPNNDNGLVGHFEILNISDQFAYAISDGRSSAELQRLADELDLYECRL